MKNYPGLYLRGEIWWYGKMIGGKRKPVSTKKRDLAEAIMVVEEWKKNPLIGGGPLLADVNRYLAERERLKTYSEASLDSKSRTLKAFAVYAHGFSTDQVSTAVVQRWYDSKLKSEENPHGCTAETCQSYVMVLRAFFEWARSKEQRIRSDNPCDGVQMQDPEIRGREDFCSKEQVSELLKECRRPDLKYILYCGFHCGLRKNEIVESMGWWFDLKSELLHLRKHPGIQFKDKEERSIPLTTEFARFLRDTKWDLDAGYMLHPKVVRGESLYRWDFDRPFLEYVDSRGMKWVTPEKRTKLTPHIMRHTFASLLVSNNEPIYNVALWLGDEIETVRKRYAKLAPEKGRTDHAFEESDQGNVALLAMLMNFATKLSRTTGSR